MLCAGMLPDGWVEFCPAEGKQDTGKFLNDLDGEVALADWDGNLKAILLRGLLDNKQFMEAMLKVVGVVAQTNTLIVLDETGVLGQSKGACVAFRKACEKLGTIRSVRPPFKDVDGGKQKGVNQVRAIVEEFAKRGKKISSQTVTNVFLEKVVPEWSYILPEIDTLVELSEGASITPKEVNDIVFPSAPNHPVYEFSIAFSEGTIAKVMEAYDNLVASKIDPEVIVAYAMKIVRWQTMAAHLASYGSPLRRARAFSASAATKRSKIGRSIGRIIMYSSME
jgi:hypothetical protein